ncbi:uncharacterized protein K02A2.6-like [Ornithodoros turicata]|uniref:uncharacterized protein K02A2.6-like n=1 Tax=Ornithodoros turicata TaxID=34597 RepID=UPI00313A0D08
MSSDIFRSKFRDKFPVHNSNVTLRNYSGSPIPVIGCFEANVVYKNVSSKINFHIVPQGTTLLGMDAISKLKLRLDGAELKRFAVSTYATALTPNLRNEFTDLFSEDIGMAKGFTHKVKIRPEVKPVASKLRRLPLTLRQQVSEELRRLQDKDIIEPVTASEWISPVVVVRKSNGSIRLCVDLREVNKAIIMDVFCLPHIEEMLNSLSEATVFSKLDLASAYHQLQLDEQSREITTFITHEGLYRFKRVCFGLSSAPAAFQRMMTKVLRGCKAVMKEITFLGHKVSGRGISPQENKVQAILDAPAPTDVAALRSFLGMAGYYSRFIPHHADVVEPLRKMLRKEEQFACHHEAGNAFRELKTLLATENILQPFDPTLDVIVTTDASSNGVGAVLQQKKDGKLRTVAFASRSLAPHEKKYSAGSGHRALRISRWCARLLAYDFKVQYYKGTENVVADALSRLPMNDETPTQFEEEIVSVVTGPISREILQEKVTEDSTLQRIQKYVADGWPSKQCLEEQDIPYFHVREELSCIEDILLREDRIVVPTPQDYETSFGGLAWMRKWNVWYAVVESAKPRIKLPNHEPNRLLPYHFQQVFSREGYPQEIVSDNGSQFKSSEFENFLKERGIKHLCSSLYYPQGNGLVERFNRTFKQYVQLASLERRPLRTAVTEYLGVFRTIPHSTTGQFPAKLLHGRQPRTRLDIVGIPTRQDPTETLQALREHVEQKQQYMKRITDERRRAKATTFRPGDLVRIRIKPRFKAEPTYSKPVKILKQCGKNSYLLQGNKVWNASKLIIARHVDSSDKHIRNADKPTVGVDLHMSSLWQHLDPSESQHNKQPQASGTSAPRTQARDQQRHAPQREIRKAHAQSHTPRQLRRSTRKKCGPNRFHY